MTALIGWQKRGGVDVERQQVPDRVLILGSIQASQRFCATGIQPELNASSVFAKLSLDGHVQQRFGIS